MEDRSRNPIILVVSASDSGGVAGQNADLRSCAALGMHAGSVLTAVTAQNTASVQGIHPIPATFITAQFQAVCADFRIGATKIGMIATEEAVLAITTALEIHKLRPVIYDPVLYASSGAPLFLGGTAIVRLLLPYVDLLTPNLSEAAHILKCPLAQTPEEMEDQASALLEYGPAAVLLKGGHQEKTKDPLSRKRISADFLASRIPQFRHWFSAPFIETRNQGGTGCTLSSAIAVKLAQGLPLIEAIAQAKTYLTKALYAGQGKRFGMGRGPVQQIFYSQNPTDLEHFSVTKWQGVFGLSET